MAEPESVDAFLARVAADPMLKDRLRQSVQTARDLFGVLGIRRTEDALLFVIGQHDGALDLAHDLRAEVDRLSALLAASGRPH